MSVNSLDTLNQLQNDTNRVNFTNSRKNLGSNRMDRDSFIRLILAQLQYQDPTNPKDSSEMLSQQLQLEQADQMNRMTTANKFSQAGSMVGQVAQLPDAPWDFNSNTTSPPEWDYETNLPKQVLGTIESVQFDRVHDKALIKINGQYYDADQVKQLFPPGTTLGGA